MTTLCQNCRQSIPPAAAFCPECGAPQLRVPTLAEREAEREAEQAAGSAAAGPIGDIVWPAALRASALYAVPAGLLLFALPVPLIRMLWVVAGAVWTLRRYRRLAPQAPPLNPQLGGRIGLLLGLFAAIVSTAADACTFLVERFALHQGAAIDEPYAAQIHQAMDSAVKINPDAAAQVKHQLQFLLSPEGVGAVRLFSVVVSAVAVLFFAWLGGRFAARYGLGLGRGPGPGPTSGAGPTSGSGPGPRRRWGRRPS